MMNMQRKIMIAGALAAALALAGCSSRDDDETPAPVVSTEVPASAGVSTGAFISYLMSLATGDESSEPLTLPDTFAVPPDESAEPTPLT